VIDVLQVAPGWRTVLAPASDAKLALDRCARSIARPVRKCTGASVSQAFACARWQSDHQHHARHNECR